MGPDGAVKILYRKEIKEAKDPKMLEKKLIDEYTEKFANPFVTASKGYIDAVIKPSETRARIIEALDLIENPDLRKEIHDEWVQSTTNNAYRCVIPEGALPNLKQVETNFPVPS